MIRGCRPHRLAIAALLLLARAGVAQHAAANVDARVRDIVYAADDAYRDGRYEQAADAFDEAYRLKPQAALLFNIGKCHEKHWLISGREPSLQAAVDAYRKYLREIDRTSPKSRHVEAEQSLERLSPALDRGPKSSAATQAVTPAARTTRLMVGASVAGATVRIDGSTPRPLPLMEPVAPGPHDIVIARAEYVSDVRHVVVAEGELFPVHADLRPAPGSVSITTRDQAAIYVDGRFAARSPLAHPLSLEPGMHDVAILEAGRVPWGRRVDVPRAGALTVDGPLRLSAYRWTSYALMGLAGAFGAYASYEAGSALAHELWARRFLSQRDSQKVLTQDDLASYNHDASARDEARTQAFTYGTVASILGLAAAGLYFMDKPTVADVVYDRQDADGEKTPTAPKPATDLTITPHVTSNAGGVDLRLSF